MDINERLDAVKQLLGPDVEDTAQDALLYTYLLAAEREILGWRYSYSSDAPDTIPDEYEPTLLFSVVAGFTISGAEGQTAHTENGIARTFKYDNMIAFIRAHVIPLVGVV